MGKPCASASGCAQISTILCAAVMVSLMAVCASWNPWPVPLGGKSKWPTEDPVVSGGQVGWVGRRLLVNVVIELPPQIDVDSAVSDPCARWRLDAVCAPLNVWNQPSPYVVLMDIHMLVNASCMSTPVRTRSAYTWPQLDTAVSGTRRDRLP